MKRPKPGRQFLRTCLTALVLIPAAIHAQSRLSITMVGNAAIRMTIDDRHYFCQDNSLTIDDLAPGYHSVKLFVVKKDRWNNNVAGQLIYNATLTLKPQFYTDIVVNRFGKTMIDEQPFAKGDFYDNNNWYDDRGRDQRFPPNIDPRGGNNNGGNNGNGGYGGSNGSNNGGNNGGYGGNGNGYGGNQPYDMQPMPMADNAFVVARDAVRRESLDNTRLLVAQQVADKNYFSTAQVREIARLFSFDDRKLDFVKYAYSRTVDKNNFFMVNDVFAFPKSKEDLANYIKNFR